MKTSILGYISLLFFKLTFFPNMDLLAWVFIAIFIDFLTGVIKAKIQGKQLTSGGFRQTVIKCLQYIGLIVGGIVMGNSLPKESEIVRWVNDGLLLFIMYVECYSIFENLYAFNPESKVAKLVFKPIMTLLTAGLERNKIPMPNVSDTTKTTTVIAFLFLIGACKTIHPGVDNFHSSTDTTTTQYKQVAVNVQGANVGNALNMDSLVRAIVAQSATKSTNVDSLVKAIMAKLKPSKDTIRISDASGKVELKYWYDEFGKLQINCASKDQTITLLVAEVSKLRTQLDKKQTTIVVKEMPWWGWLIIGGSILISLIFVPILYIVIRR